MTLTDIPAASDDSGADPYAELLRDAPRTGRCPIILGYDVHDGPDVPCGSVAAIDSIDPQVVLAGWWPGGPCRTGCPCEGEMSGEMPDDPVGPSFPDRSREPGTIAAAARFAGGTDRLWMVDVTRPADAPAALGWPGICNYQPYQDLERLCAVLRRWEERYGAILVTVSSSRLYLSVAYPPDTDDECRRVAAEHFAFCPDQQDPQNGDFYSLSRYARMIRGSGSWSFWWD